MLFFQECHGTITAGGTIYTTRHVYTNSKYFCFQHGSENKSYDFRGVPSVDGKEIGRDAPG